MVSTPIKTNLDKYQEFAIAQFGSEAIAEQTQYGFVVKVRNRRGQFDKHAFKVSGDEYKPLKLTAWTDKISVEVLPEAIAKQKGGNIAYITPEQEAIAIEWQEKLRWVWNAGLDLLDQFTRTHAYSKIDKQWHACCPLSLVVDGIRFPVTDESYSWRKEDGEFYPALCCKLFRTPKKRRRSKFRPSCARSPVPETPYKVDENGEIVESFPVIWDEGTGILNGIGDKDLGAVFAQKNNPDKPWLKEIPAQPVRSVLKELAESYGNYLWKKGGGKPRFKSGRRGDHVNSLVFEDGAAIGKIWDEDGQLIGIKIPRLGDIYLPKSARKTWQDLPIAVVKLHWDCGWSLQLTTSQRPAPGLKPKDSTATIEVVGRQGVLFKDDKGKEYTIAYARQVELERAIEGKQKHLARQQELLQKAIDREAEPKEIETRKRKIEETKLKIRQLHRKIRLSGKAESQKLATFALRRTGSIKVIDKPYHGMLLKPEPIPTPGSIEGYDPNGAEEVARINRSRKLHRTGQFVSLLQQKAEFYDRPIEIEKEDKKSTKKSKTKKQKPK